jgi:hypothetical protein
MLGLVKRIPEDVPCLLKCIKEIWEPNQELELKAREIKHPNNIFSPITSLQLPLPLKILALP